MGKYYIENRVWYVGYTWINFDNDNISTIAKEEGSAFSHFNKCSFASNHYAGEEGEDSSNNNSLNEGKDLLYTSYTVDALDGKFQIDDYDSSKTQLEFKFLTNGCVNIILTMVPKEPGSFSQQVKNLDRQGVESSPAFRKDILALLLPLLQKLIDEKIIECHNTSLWGIPSLLSIKPLNLDLIRDFGDDSIKDNMRGTRSRNDSIMYVQHIVSEDEDDYNEFKGERTRVASKDGVDSYEYKSVKGEITLRTSSTEKNANQTMRTTIGNGKLYWNGGLNEYQDVKTFLEAEAVLLSKNVIVTTSITFNTELSFILLKDNDLCAKASVDDLRKPNALLRTHLACTEMYVPELTEEPLSFYEKYENIEGKMIYDRIILQKECEETLFQIANSTELSKNDMKTEWFQFILVAISAMTVFSVLQDVASFIFIDPVPEPQYYRFTFIAIMGALLGLVMWSQVPRKK